jgi:hypothetical protein
MHTEKNLAHNIVHTIMGTKDTAKVQEDMEELKVQKHLWMQPSRNADGTVGAPTKPPAFLKVLTGWRVPGGFSSSWGKCVTAKKKLAGLKSHDYHQLMQQILPLALSGLMSEGARLTIAMVSSIWRRICSKVWDPSTFQTLKDDVAVALCLMEMHFPPSFFDPRTHLMVHIVDELDLCGPVHDRWMYPIERNLKTHKNRVRNKGRPEASMAEGYLIEESLGFLTRLDFMAGSLVAKRAQVKAMREDPDIIHLQGVGSHIQIPHRQLLAMHHYVLENTDCIKAWYR